VGTDELKSPDESSFVSCSDSLASFPLLLLKVFGSKIMEVGEERIV
jgi:hypothetical protein